MRNSTRPHLILAPLGAKPLNALKTSFDGFSARLKRAPNCLFQRMLGTESGKPALPFMANKKSKPTIPEPSPRFFVWSLAIGFLILAGVLGYSLATGYSGYRPPPANEGAPRKIERQGSLTGAVSHRLVEF